MWAGILELFVCGVYGLVVMEGQLLYDIEYYSLMRATLTHFLIILFGLFLLGLSFGWQPDDEMLDDVAGGGRPDPTDAHKNTKYCPKRGNKEAHVFRDNGNRRPGKIIPFWDDVQYSCI